MADWERYKMRREVLRDIERIVEAGAPQNGKHLLVLNDYQVANLKELIFATGYASVYKSPINVVHNGDWVGELHHMLSTCDTDSKPNATAEELTKKANNYEQL